MPTSYLTNRKLHMRFRLPPRLMTLDNLEVRIFGEFRGISQIWEATTAKRMKKIDTYCQRERCNPLNVLFKIMFLALIRRRFLR